MKSVLFLLLVFLSFESRSFTVVSLEPYARMNAAKTHYFISVPETPRSKKGYTAVLDAKTKQVTFKLDQYFTNRQILLSNDGERLIQVESLVSRSEESCSATIYTREGQGKKVPVFRRKSRNVDDIFYVSNLMDLEEVNGRFVFYTADSMYILDAQGTVVTEKNILPGTYKAFERFKKGDLDNDPYFDLAQLKKGGVEVVKQLAKDLGVKLVSDKKKARRAVFFNVTLLPDGTLSFIDLDAAIILDLEKGKWGPDENLEQAILQKLKTYHYDAGTVPEGLPYRTFSGNMYLLK